MGTGVRRDDQSITVELTGLDRVINWRRVGTMLGRTVIGKQFWAVPAGPQDEQLLVFDFDSLEFSRAVLSVGNGVGIGLRSRVVVPSMLGTWSQ
jgi:hypothetical protein